MRILNESDVRHISRLCRKLRLFCIEWISARRVLITVLGIEELRVPLVEVVDKEIISDVGEVHEIIDLRRLFSDRVKVYAHLLGDGILRMSVMQ